MALWQDLMRWLRREATDARVWADEAVTDGHVALDRAERRLHATPEERMQATLADIAAGEEALAEVRAKAESAQARPAADREVAEVDGPAADAPDGARDGPGSN